MSVLDHMRAFFQRRTVDGNASNEDCALAKLAHERRDALIRGETDTIPFEQFFKELEREHPAPS